ncbi:MAG TPA: SBBP repeat-containing protein, partial [Blastocatellia bacterium]|nr:SBBP repeat-containing protein [Blastocatellia bacterium]
MFRAKYKVAYAVVFALILATTTAIALPATLLTVPKSVPKASGAPESSVPPSAVLPRSIRRDTSGIDAAYGKLPLVFEANQGQLPANVKFVSRSAGRNLFLTSNAATVVVAKGDATKQPGTDRGTAGAHGLAVEMKLKGANPHAEIGGGALLPGTDNYFLGNDPSRWRTGIPTYGRVLYRGIYPGVDLAYHGSDQQLEYDFSVAPHVDPRVIRLSFRGLKNMRLDQNGDLVLATTAGEIRHLKPSVYQQDGDTRHYITGRFSIRGKNDVGFNVESYDTSKELVIDPIFVYSSFLGGTSFDVGKAITVDSFGNAYLTGSTSSFNFPATINAFQTTFAAGTDVFVTKLDPTGSSLVYSTFIGGNGDDTPTSIAVDGAGNAYVGGEEGSTNFPVTLGAYDTTEPTSIDERAFITKLNSTGTALVYSTFFGPSGFQFSQAGTFINGIAVDSFDIAYLTGSVAGGPLPTTGDAHQLTSGGNQDAFF